MSDFAKAIEQVRDREAKAKRAYEKARRKAEDLVVHADRQGREEYEAAIKQAEIDRVGTLEKGKKEAEKLRSKIERETEEKLADINKRAKEHFEKAVDFVLDAFMKEYQGEVP